MTGASFIELRFRFKANHRYTCFYQFVGIKSGAFLKRNSVFGEIAATYAASLAPGSALVTAPRCVRQRNSFAIWSWRVFSYS